MKKIVVLVSTVLLSISLNAQTNNDSIIKSNKKLIEDLKYRINTIDNIGKTKSADELEVEALKLFIKTQNDSIVKLNALLKNYADVLNSAPVGDGKFKNNSFSNNINEVNSKTKNVKQVTSKTDGNTDVELNATLSNSELIKQLEANCNCELLMYVPYQTSLNYQNYNELNSIGEKLKSNPNIQLTITGHADKSGNETQNIKLSKLRAQNLKSYFVDELNITPASIKIEWKGSSAPLQGIDDSNASLNRRSELLVR